MNGMEHILFLSLKRKPIYKIFIKKKFIMLNIKRKNDLQVIPENLNTVSGNTFLEKFQQGVNSLVGEISQLRRENRSQYSDLKQDTETIKHAVVKQPKAKRIQKPLRAAATLDVYYHLMNLPQQKKERILSYSRFRVAITLLWFTGLRINEIRNLNQKEIQALIDDGALQVYQPKVNKHREVLIPHSGQQALEILKDEIHTVFKNHDSLSGNASRGSWIRFLNRRLVMYTDGVFKNVRSHSFRINYATSLLRKAPLEVVAEMIGHRDIKTTLKYNRYVVSKDERLSILGDALEKYARDPTI